MNEIEIKTSDPEYNIYIIPDEGTGEDDDCIMIMSLDENANEQIIYCLRDEARQLAAALLQAAGESEATNGNE